MIKSLIKVEESGRAPPALRDLSKFIKDLIFTPDEDPTSVIGTRLPPAFRSDLREIILMFLKEEMPMDILRLEQKMLRHLVYKMKDKMKSLLPMTEEIMQTTLKEMYAKAKKKSLSNNTETKRVWTWIARLHNAIDPGIQKTMVSILQRLQGAMVKGRPVPLLTGDGVMGEAPPTRDLCQVYASFIQEAASHIKRPPRQRLEVPTVWRQKPEGIFRADLCPLTGKWFWSKVAVCACKADMDTMPVEEDDMEYY